MYLFVFGSEFAPAVLNYAFVSVEVVKFLKIGGEMTVISCVFKSQVFCVDEL